jgi:5-methylthioribose kinase
MDTPDLYRPLTPEELGTRLSAVPVIAGRVGADPSRWTVKEVGDGNLNLVFIVEGPQGTVIVKQALPYVRLVGDSWPLPLYRAYYENNALVRQAERDPGSVPEVYHFDEAQALIVMEFLSPHKILRRKLIDGEKVDGLGQFLGRFCARTAFRGSELSLKSADKKNDVGLFSGNIEIPAITEALVFTDPYYDAKMNHHTPGLDPVVTELRGNVRLKAQVQRMLMKFASNTETMLHGDLHSGSIMSTETESKVIDPEFVQYGPMGFDIGMLVANFLMAYFSQPAHRDAAGWSLTRSGFSRSSTRCSPPSRQSSRPSGRASAPVCSILPRCSRTRASPAPASARTCWRISAPTRSASAASRCTAARCHSPTMPISRTSRTPPEEPSRSPQSGHGRGAHPARREFGSTASLLDLARQFNAKDIL